MIDEKIIMGVRNKNADAKKELISLTKDHLIRTIYKRYIGLEEKEINDILQATYTYAFMHMDKLNDDMLQQEIGAYYTPVEYSEKSLELLRKAIIQVPAGNDYVIIDRCAGTGNLEEKMTDEELKHCILNTYEYFEWLELRRQYEDRVRYVVPKSAATYVRGEGVIKEGDALTEDFFKDPNIRQYINNPKVSVIVFENPPYFSGTNNQAAIVVNAASGEGGKKRSTKSVENNWIIERMIDEGYTKASIANTVRQFIWSAYKDYLRQNGDSLVVYSPASYFNWYDIQSKTMHLKFDTGFGFNRKHFHASDALHILRLLQMLLRLPDVPGTLRESGSFLLIPGSHGYILPPQTVFPDLARLQSYPDSFSGFLLK